MDTVNILWFIALLSVGAAALWFKGDQKRYATILLLLVMTVYVGSKYYQSIVVEKRLNKSGPSIDVDRAELMLRINSALSAAKSTAAKSVKGLPGGAAAQAAVGDKVDGIGEAKKVLKSAAEAEPDSASAWGKLLVVEHKEGASKSEIAATLEHLGTIKTPAGQQLYNSFKELLEGQLQIGTREQEIKKVLLHEFPSGWYQEQALEILYRKAFDKTQLNDLLSETTGKNMLLVAKLGGLVVFGALSLLIGVIIIFIQLLFVARNSAAVDESALVKAPVHTGFATIYGVFIGWVTTQNLIGSLAQNALKSMSPILKMSSGMEPGSNKPMLIALTVAVLYILSNGPGTLYAYLFAMRPAKISFFEGFRLRAHVGKRGPVFLVLAGIATWFVAVPLVLGATWIGYQFLGSQGSTNPIIALVMEAARSGNWLSTVLFYLTLGVLAPICEETLFRGFLYANLRRTMGVFPSMVISAGLFAGFHMDMGAFLPLFTLGSLFALVFEKQKSILPSMVAHGLWNSGTFTLLLLLFG